MNINETPNILEGNATSSPNLSLNENEVLDHVDEASIENEAELLQENVETDAKNEAELLLENVESADEEKPKLLHENVKSETKVQFDAEMAVIMASFKEMEEEAAKIEQMQTEMNNQMANSSTGQTSEQQSLEQDTRSIYVGNVDYGTTELELESHFSECGTINRVKIQRNKADGLPKGFAYIEFAAKECVALALDLNETLFRGRQIKVVAKRTNRPGISTTNRFPRGSFRGRIGGRGGRGSRSGVHASLRGSSRWPTRQPGRSNYYSPY